MEKYQKLVLVQFTLLIALVISFLFAKEFIIAPIIVGVLNCIAFIFTIGSIGESINARERDAREYSDYRGKQLDEYLGVLVKNLEYLEFSQKERFEEYLTTFKSVSEVGVSDVSNLKNELNGLFSDNSLLIINKINELTNVSIEYSKNIEHLINGIGESTNNSAVLSCSIDRLIDSITKNLASLESLIKENSDSQISATEIQTGVFKDESALVKEQLNVLSNEFKEISENETNLKIEVLSKMKNDISKLNVELIEVINKNNKSVTETLTNSFENIKTVFSDSVSSSKQTAITNNDELKEFFSVGLETLLETNKQVVEEQTKSLIDEQKYLKSTLSDLHKEDKELLDINLKNLLSKDVDILQEISNKIDYLNVIENITNISTEIINNINQNTTAITDAMKESSDESNSIIKNDMAKVVSCLESFNNQFNDLEDVALNTNIAQDNLINTVDVLCKDLIKVSNNMEQFDTRVDLLNDNVTEVNNEVHQFNDEFQNLKIALDDSLSDNENAVIELKELVGSSTTIIENINEKINNDNEEIKELYKVNTKELIDSIGEEVGKVGDKLDTVNDSVDVLKENLDESVKNHTEELILNAKENVNKINEETNKAIDVIKEKCDLIARSIDDTKKEIVESFNEISSKDFEKLDRKLSDSISSLNRLFKEEGNHDSTVIAEVIKKNTNTITNLVTDFNEIIKSIKSPNEVNDNDIVEVKCEEELIKSNSPSTEAAMTIIEDVTEESTKAIKGRPLLSEDQDEINIVKDDNGTKYFKGNKIIKYEENDGTVTEFKYKDDQIQKSIIKKHGQLAMQIRFEDGNIVEARHFRKGKLTDHYLYYPSGKLKKSITFDGDEITTVEFDEETQEVIN